MASFYPLIKESSIMDLEIASRSVKKDPSYLDHVDCPYPATVKDYIRSLAVNVGGVEEVVNIFEESDELLVIDQQIHKVLSSLEAMAGQMLKADTSERLNYLKAKTSLIEKLIGLRERNFNLREVSEFRNLMLTIFDQICTKDQITEVMKRLDGTLGIEVTA